ncbi:MAG: hypothetical protein COY36_02395 [Zetaproteobacteria bacterium CG_4_10_14_0_2_um_filter_55_20]|nr:MAG: hypothetical protein COT53_04715 [Zetaproteobacteria bacterium CG08_land_8_20_14_0_20_55_17]PIY51467.1 MAG: hypothetical protein COZ01_11085 [Zetaproteobacteria bacterium CG_4_10_14_0_8_um_filter_55_43]PIZ39606.1 MAG: hypothetical protein COY36_02395 [Zetaproteobacteria bacterium CG_4_10_14_0_2_um_filter_55_20]
MHEKKRQAMRPVLSLLPILALLVPIHGWAGPQRTAELDRPIISLLPANSFELWAQYDEFNGANDFFGYRKKTGGTTSLDLHRTYWFGGKYAATDRLNLRFDISQSRQNVSRTTEPKQLNAEYSGYHARLQYIFYKSDNYQFAAEAGYRAHKLKQQDFYTYDLLFPNAAVTITWPGHALVSATASDQAWLGALRGTAYLSRNWLLSAGMEARYLTVKAHTWSDEPLIESRLRLEAPQLTPWKETHLLADVGLDWLPFKAVTLAAHYTYYQIRRNGYIAGPTGPTDVEYTSNHQLDGYLFWHATRNFTLYGHGRASRRFVLGDLPLAYNRRSNHKFTQPFGYLSFGAAYTF